jgi:hypothetical protein
LRIRKFVPAKVQLLHHHHDGHHYDDFAKTISDSHREIANLSRRASQWKLALNVADATLVPILQKLWKVNGQLRVGWKNCRVTKLKLRNWQRTNINSWFNQLKPFHTLDVFFGHSPDIRSFQLLSSQNFSEAAKTHPWCRWGSW